MVISASSITSFYVKDEEVVVSLNVHFFLCKET